MPCNDYLTFKKVNHYGAPNIIRNTEVNLKHYFDWAFLKIGAWRNVDATSSGVYGGNFYTLRNVDDDGYSDGLVYGSIRKDWVYETGVNYESPSIPVTNINYNVSESQNQVFTDYSHNFSSGVNVTISNNSVYNGSYDVIGTSGSNSFYIDLAENSGNGTGGSVFGIYNPVTPTIYSNGSPVSTGNYSINYPLGQVVFSTSQAGNTITADYSYRQVQTYLSDDLPWFFEVQYDSLDPRDKHWMQNINSGDFEVMAQNRIQLPAVVIELASNRNIKPYELGGIKNIVKQNFKFHVISQNKYERDTIVDILANQKDSVIWLYDEAKVHNYSVYSLDYRGDKNSEGLNYPGFVSNDLYRYQKARFKDISVSNIKTNSPFLHIGVVVAGMELIT